MFDRFDIIRIVNLPHHKDRLREMPDELKEVGLAGDPRSSSSLRTVTPRRGGSIRPARGCFSSHLAILREAAVLPWVEAAWESDDPAPIDGEYIRFRRGNPDIVTVFAEPQAAVLRPSRTDVGPQRLFDRVPGLREVAGLARKARQALANGRGDG